MDPRLSLLTDAQRECLRLVHQHKTTAEIAHLLDIADVTVNKRIDRARHKLGGISRGQAAQLLAEAEGLPTYDKIIRSEISLSDTDQAPILAAPGRDGARRLPWPFRTREQPNNDLSINARLLLSMGLTGGMATVAALISLAVILLMRLLMDMSRNGG